MGCFIKDKKSKIQAVFSKLGSSVDEEQFASLFKDMYPDDWKRICDKWQEENSISNKPLLLSGVNCRHDSKLIR